MNQLSRDAPNIKGYQNIFYFDIKRVCNKDILSRVKLYPFFEANKKDILNRPFKALEHRGSCLVCEHILTTP